MAVDCGYITIRLWTVDLYKMFQGHSLDSSLLKPLEPLKPLKKHNLKNMFVEQSDRYILRTSISSRQGNRLQDSIG